MTSGNASYFVAVGDIHGDLAKAIALFKLAGVVEERERRLIWIGGDTTVVQLGDVLDRGSQEIGDLLPPLNTTAQFYSSLFIEPLISFCSGSNAL